MNIELRKRTKQHVRIYHERTQDPEIRQHLPKTVVSLEQAMQNYENTLKPDATSYGATIYVDGSYVGDVWCYGMDPSGTPQAMVSYCIFEKSCWGRGIMTRVLSLFLEDCTSRFGITCFGAFVFSSNTASIRVLEKNGFTPKETFQEDGVQSFYYQLNH